MAIFGKQPILEVSSTSIEDEVIQEPSTISKLVETGLPKITEMSLLFIDNTRRCLHCQAHYH